MKKYFLHNANGQEGPFDIEELKKKNITKATPIWYEGLKDWVAAGEVEELKNIFVATPPPFKPQTQASTSIKEQPKKKNRVVLYIILGLILVLLIINVPNLFNNHSSSYQDPFYTGTYQEKVMSVEEIERANPLNFLDASGTYNENFFGNKFKIHGVITNKATVASYKDIQIRVIYYSKTKTILKTNYYTIYEVVGPNSKKEFELKVENYQNVNSIGWDVSKAINL